MLTSYISFLQLGDIHYPDLVKTHPLVDHKDKGISTLMASAVSSSRVAEITRGINQIRQDEANLVAVILTGDLTTKGNNSGYKECLTFLHGALQLSDEKYWENRRLLVVPGNHDIDRQTIISGQPLLKKFEPLLENWNDIFGNSNFLTVNAPTPTDLPTLVPGTSTPSIRFLPLNTCFLCGEYRTFPDQIRESVAELLIALEATISSDEFAKMLLEKSVMERIDELKEAITSDKFEKIMNEQIDCPAVAREHVQVLEKHINQSDIDSVTVVVGHHPLFAQPMPRIDGYTELLNAGFVRETVLETGKNVIYLHGHIHQDPLLTLNSPIKGSHRLIHLSAPALEDGFNLVRVFFSDETNQPLGLELTRYRFNDQLGLSKLAPIKLRLIDKDALWNEIDQPWIKYVLEKLYSPQLLLRFKEFLKNVPTDLTCRIDKSEEHELKNALLILELLELIEIVNRDKSFNHWQCRRITI